MECWLDGRKNYRLRMPGNLPAKDFWRANSLIKLLV